MKPVIGVDIGGSGIKMALVDVKTGQLMSDRIRVATPKNGLPKQIAKIISQTIKENKWKGNVGIGFPTPIRKGRCVYHSNLHENWEGMKLVRFFEKELGRKVKVGNDVDVAALAEVRFGKVPRTAKLVVFLAFGTGIGSAIIYENRLISGTELGHAKWKKGIIEDYISDRVRKTEGLSWKQWGKRLTKVLDHYDFILAADCYIIGGGVSKKFEHFKDYVKFDKLVKPAELQNNAGIVGAALLVG